MSTVRMRHIDFIGLKRDRQEIFSELAKFGFVEISAPCCVDETTGEMIEKEIHLSEEASEWFKKRETLLKAMDVLAPYDQRKKGLFTPRRAISEDELNETVAAEDEIMAKAQDACSFDGQILDMDTEASKLSAKLTRLEPWLSYQYNLSDTKTKTTVTEYFYTDSQKSIDKFLEALDESNVSYGYDTISVNKKDTYFVITYLSSCSELFNKAFEASDITRMDLSEFDGTASDIQKTISDEIDVRFFDKDYLIQKRAEYAAYISDFEILYDYYGICIEKDKAQAKSEEGRMTFSFEGWIPEKCESKMQRILPKKFVCHIETRDPEEGELPPTLLKNRILGDSLESVESMYSVLRYGAVDASSVAAFFFALFFGFMLSDAGYGIIMTVATLIILLKCKPENGLKKYMTLFFFCGISTIFWGALFGSWFGNLVSTVTFGKISLKPIWFDPTDNANLEHFMALTLLLGVIHLFVAYGIKAYDYIRQGHWLDAICDVFFWYIFYVGEIFFLLPYIPYYGESAFCKAVHPYGVYLLIIGFVLILFTKGRKSSNLFVRCFGGITCVYSLIDMLSDALSYTRLMAMGLATAVIINVFNQIGASAGGLNAGVITIRFIFFVLIFLAANAFNFAINALSSYVNACRLTYIEFFGKFYEGDGKAYEPLCENTEYVVINKYDTPDNGAVR